MKEGQEMVAERGKRKEKITKMSQATNVKEMSSIMSTPGTIPATSPMSDMTKNPAVMTRTVNLKVNGREHNIQVEPHWPLRDVLRQKLGLTSIKDFCNGYGACGSCTVIMNSRPVLSCMILAIEAEGAVIETVEGISDAKHPLIEAYIMNWAAQCGYCTPGFIVTAKALLDHNQNPTVEEIKEALSGNLCRCGSYPVHIKAVQDAARILRGEK
jgi:aerobic-type carbon monoxide dehydrogenase small subunit (CoxS/CutS family)